MLRCEARILRTFKRAKAQVIWPKCCPSGDPMPTPNVPPDAEVCGGEISLTVEAVDDPYYGGHSARLDVKAECSRCQAPYWEGRFVLDREPGPELAAAYLMVAARAQQQAARLGPVADAGTAAATREHHPALTMTLALSPREQEALDEDLRKLLGLDPYNHPSNICWNDGYFHKSLEQKYGQTAVAEGTKRLLREAGRS